MLSREAAQAKGVSQNEIGEIRMSAKYFYYPLLVLMSFSDYANPLPDLQEKINNIVEVIYKAEESYNTEISDDLVFSSRGQFESTSDYRNRLNKAEQRDRKLRKQYFTDLFLEYARLREQQYPSQNIDNIEISLGIYNADKETYEINLPKPFREEENHKLLIPIKREKAETLFNNWFKYEKQGYVVSDVFKENSLVRLLLRYGDSANTIEYQINRPILTLPISTDVQYNSVRAIKYIEFKNGFLHCFGEPSRLSSYDVANKTLTNFDLPVSEISVFAYNDDLSKYSIGLNDTIIVASSSTNNRLYTFAQPKYHNVSSLDFSKDGKYLLASTMRGDVAIYDLTSGDLVYTQAKTTDDAIFGAKFSSDSELIAIGWDGFPSSTMGGGGAEVIEWRTDSTLFYFEHEYGVSSVSFSNYKHLLGTGGKNGLKVFDLQSGALVSSVARNNINAILFSPDDLFLVIGSGDLFNLYKGFGVSVFNRMTGRFVPFGDVPQPVQSLAFSRDGLYIGVGCYGGDAFVFRALY